MNRADYERAFCFVSWFDQAPPEIFAKAEPKSI
jgi:hypothetical protein